MREGLHKINVQYPWLKILGMILVIVGVACGTIGVLREDAGQVGEGDQVIGVEDGEQTEGGNVKEEQGGDEAVEGGADASGEKPADTSEPEKPTNTPPASIPSADTGKKLVALTFDDGPSATTTSRLLDVLAEKQVKVTFFVLGNMAQKSPALIQREVAEGHEVESHTMSHQNLIKLSAAGIQGEVSGADAVLQEITGSPAKLVRPPYGSINDAVRANVGKPMILWTVDPEDWKYKDAATVKVNVVSKTFDGAIVLMHDIYGTTVDAVGAIIDELRAAGYEFLTVSELAAARGVGLQNGYSYGSFRP